MSNLEIYERVFIESFRVKESQLDSLTYRSVSGWNSVGHVIMISALEEAFEISFNSDDIIDFSSYNRGKEILKKYNICI